jgi:hypothetical protein
VARFGARDVVDRNVDAGVSAADTRRSTGVVAFVARVSLVGIALSAPAAAQAQLQPAPQPPLPASDYAVRPVCGGAPMAGRASCFALELVPVTAAARAHTHRLGLAGSAPLEPPKPLAGVRAAGSAAQGLWGLRPQDLHSAYTLPDATPATAGQTIAIVDAYNDPSAESDLRVYDEEFGLPPCTAGNGCFRQLNETGHSSQLPETQEEWAQEIALDVETAHAVCQSCRIALIEAASNRFSDLEEAEREALRLHASAVSNSWGGEEPARDSETFNDPGVAVTAATGDFGYRNWDAPEGSRQSVDYPASSPHVVAVGGTRLTLASGGRWSAEVVWNGQGASGGGCSERFGAPVWQRSLPDWSSVGCEAMRALADVSADADPYTGVAVYHTQNGGATPGWETLGGTSLATPIIAATFALAGGVHSASGYAAQALYEGELTVADSLHDIESGSNGECARPFTPGGLSGCTTVEEAANCGGRAICLAGPGYDGPAGVGTPNGICAFEAPGMCVVAPGPESRPESSSGEVPNEAGERGLRGLGPEGGGSADLAPDASSGARAPSPQTPPRARRRFRISHLGLTRDASAALHRPRGARPLVRSQLSFTFVLNSADRVHVALARLASGGGRTRWQTVGVPLTIFARAGRDRARLTGDETLAAGRYRLTLSPVAGRARSITIDLG